MGSCIDNGYHEGSRSKMRSNRSSSRRSAVLQLAHTIPLGGHLGKKKTSAKIMKRFYWPTQYRDVEDFCRSCAKCQKAGHRRVQRAPLVPLPIKAEPFKRIAMDVVGPLPCSRAGHRYVLVVCDYATQYPEAVAMRSVDAENVAEELVRIFSTVGIPKEILTDQGTNFTSELLVVCYILMASAPVHTTLKQMGWWKGLMEHSRRCSESVLLRMERIGTIFYHMYSLPTVRLHMSRLDSHHLSYCMGQKFGDPLMC